MKVLYLAALAIVSLVPGLSAYAQQTFPGGPAIRLGSTPETVIRGHIPSDRPPVLRVKSGQTVAIDTLSHQGMNSKDGPVAFFGRGGVKSDDVLKDAVDVYGTVHPPAGGGTHVLTGPIYIEGAEPGDQLEVRVVNVEFRVPYGVNATNKGSGVLPALMSEPVFRVIPFDMDRGVVRFSPEIEVPLSPFMGIMAVAPPPEMKNVSSRPPGAFGGNLDLKQLTRGASLYLPVFNDGALFFTGDAHGAQGDGEVNGTAIEVSLRPTFQFIVHKGKGRSMTWPRAETPTHYIAIGMDRDLNLAMKAAAQEAVNFLMQEKGLSAAQAYALASIGVDFRVAEAVNLVQVIYGMIPKSLFRSKQDYWYKP